MTSLARLARKSAIEQPGPPDAGRQTRQDKPPMAATAPRTPTVVHLPSRTPNITPRGHARCVSALRTILRKFVNSCKELGPLNAFLWGINRHFIHRGRLSPLIRYYFVAQPVHDAPVLRGRLGRSIEVRLLAPGDPALAALPLTEDVLKFRFAQDAICFGAFKNGQILGCLWLCQARYSEDEVRCSLILRPEGKVAWDFDVYVAPEVRGGLTFVRLWDEANAFMRGQGVEWSVSRISAFNPESLAAHRRLGARRISSALFLRIGGMQILLSGSRPFFSVSTPSGRVPGIFLSVARRYSRP